MTETICKNGYCTACGACENICPRICVTRRNTASSITMLKGKQCINCGLCEKVCPSNKEPLLNEPKNAYIANANDKDVWKNSASGGIASALYRYFIGIGYSVVGAELDSNKECKLNITRNLSEIDGFKNSKYTYSYASEVYKETKKRLDAGEGVFFVGLPCQVAALKSYIDMSHTKTEKLFTADIICHGTPIPEYFKQHVSYVSKKLNDNVEKCYFRDPKYGTEKFVLSFYNYAGKQIYSKFVKEYDMYQIGYHSALIYRDSCYSCRYAQFQRAGDITLGDYHARQVDIGELNIVKKSLLMVNTELGKDFLDALVREGIVSVLARPLQEPYNGEPQLRHPSVAGQEREVFINRFARCNDFDSAAKYAFRGIVIRRLLRVDMCLKLKKASASKIIPKEVYRKIKGSH